MFVDQRVVNNSIGSQMITCTLVSPITSTTISIIISTVILSSNISTSTQVGPLLIVISTSNKRGDTYYKKK